MHWCSDAMLADAFAEFEVFDLRVQKVRVPRTLREALWERGTSIKDGAGALLWGVPLVTASVIEVHGSIPCKEVWPARQSHPYIRLTQGAFELNFTTTPERSIRRARVRRVPYKPGTRHANA